MQERAADSAAVDYIKHRFFKPLFRRTLAKRPGKVAARTPLANALARRHALLVNFQDEVWLYDCGSASNIGPGPKTPQATVFPKKSNS